MATFGRKDPLTTTATTAGSRLSVPAGKYVRARASDNGGVYSEWTEAARLKTYGSEVRVNAAVKGLQVSPVVIVHPVTRNAVVVWSGQDPGKNSPTGLNIYLRTFSPSGTPVQASDVLVNSNTKDGEQAPPAIAVDAAGNFVVVWTSSVPKPDDGSGVPKFLNTIYFRRYSASGSPLDAEKVVSQATNDARREPAVAMNAKGQFVIAWTGGAKVSGKANEDVFVRVYAANGNAVTQAVRATR